MSVYYEKLKDRDLWIDGESSLSIDTICDRIFSGEEPTEILKNNLISERDQKEIKRFLTLTPEHKNVQAVFKDKASIKKLDTSFDIHDSYKNKSIEHVLVKKLKGEIIKKNLTDDETMERVDRIEKEIQLFRNHGLHDVLGACLYIVDTLKRRSVVWGPGRGSACCSYVLYLIGIHNIDSVAFELEINEFLR